MIDQPGIYRLTDDDYFADPCPAPSLSASIAKTLISATPMHAADEHPRLSVPGLTDEEDEEEEGKFDLGSAVHTMVLGWGGEIVEVDAKAWNTKDAKASRDDARAHGATPLLKKQARKARLMASRIDAQLRERFGRNPFDDRENNEKTIIWRGEAGIWCRCKPDHLDFENRIAWDLKTTGMLANPQSWSETQVRSTGLNLRAAHYLHGIRRVIGPDWRYRFVVCEAQRPHCLSVLELPGSLLDLGEDERHHAAMRWGRCLALGTWPGWANAVVTVEDKGWEERKWLDRRDNPVSQTAIEIAREMQAPRS